MRKTTTIPTTPTTKCTKHHEKSYLLYAFVCFVAAIHCCLWKRTTDDSLAKTLQVGNDNNRNSSRDNNVVHTNNNNSRNRSKQDVLLVHIGKSGGISLRSFIFDVAKEECVNGTHHNYQHYLHTEFCSWMRVHSRVVHMRAFRDKIYPRYRHFLIPIRNPIDRLRSWYDFEYVLARLEGYERFGTKKLCWLREHCYRTFSDLITKGVVVPQQLSSTNNSSSSIGSTTTTTTAINLTKCQKLAGRCLRGETMCAVHNFYNFEYYLEDLIAWKECHVDENTNNTNKTVIKRRQKPFKSLYCTQERKDIHIDVIRVEHAKNDLQQLMEVWTDNAPTVLNSNGDVMDAMGYGKKNDLGHHMTQGYNNNFNASAAASAAAVANFISNNQVPHEGIQKLCRMICTELVVYKKILRYANNINPHQRQESYKELDERCGFSVDEVCGTAFHFRNTAARKHRCLSDAPC